MGASVAASSELLSTTARLGEVIETGTTGFWAESDELHELPELGSLVWVRGVSTKRMFGVVTYGETAGLDPSRRAVRRGSSVLADDAIYARHPELEFVLRTLFHVALVGSDLDGRVRHVLPPTPAPLHYSVQPCSVKEICWFSDDPGYLPELLNHAGVTPAEQVVAGHLIWVDRQRNDGHAWLACATRHLARLMKRDYDRLSIILRAVDPG
jgi:hypothetical protein